MNDMTSTQIRQAERRAAAALRRATAAQENAAAAAALASSAARHLPCPRAAAPHGDAWAAAQAVGAWLAAREAATGETVPRAAIAAMIGLLAADAALPPETAYPRALAVVAARRSERVAARAAAQAAQAARKAAAALEAARHRRAQARQAEIAQWGGARPIPGPGDRDR